MIRTNGLRAFLIACATLVIGTTIAPAQDRDTMEVQRFVLTEAGLAKYRQATKNLALLKGTIPDTCNDDSSATSLDALAQKLNAVPAVKAAIQSAGMTTREYVLFSWSLFQNGLAAWAVSQPGGKLPAGISKSNVDFFRKHEAEVKQLGGAGCDDDTEEEDRN